MKTVFTLTTFLLCLSAYSQNQNKAGTLDSSFGVNGKVITSSELGYLEITAATHLSDGSIIVAGNDGSLDGLGGMLAMKYSPDGLLDSSYGNNGLAVIYGTGIGWAVAAQPDNKVIIAGYSAEMFGPYYVNVARLNANGSIDSSFASIGFIQSLASDFGRAIAIQTDGKILITGDHRSNATTLRYLPDGTPDKSFGNNGVVETEFGNSISSGNTILIQPDNKIVIAGRTDKELLLGRYNTDGSLDETFGNKGKILYNISNGVDVIEDIALQLDGKIVAVGSTFSLFGDTSNTIVLRYMPDGSLDKNFGINGLTIYKMSTKTNLESVALQKDGKIITAGKTEDIAGLHVHFLAERYDTNGIIDSTFGNDGYQITEMDESDAAHAALLQKNGKIVLAGSAFNDSTLGPTEYRVALARYNNDETKKQIIINKIKHYIETHNNVEASTLNKVSIYPNPAINNLHIEGLSSSKTKLTVVDIAGNIKLQIVVNASSYNLNIASLQAGNYLLKIEMNGEVITKQFVKE
jgi:uncharacterized delta-60 repeat protein